MEVGNFLTFIRFKNTTIVVLYVALFSSLITRLINSNELVLVVLSNILAIWAIYGFNDLEDAKLEPSLKKRRKFIHKNMVLNGKIPENFAAVSIVILAALSLIVASAIGFLNVYAILSILIIGFLYSSRYVRLKSKPPLDVLSHAIIGPLIPFGIFLNAGLNALFLVTLASFFLGSLVPEILNQRYDYSLDRKNNIRTTVQLLGKTLSLKLIMLLAFAIIALNGIVFFLYGGSNLLLIYLLMSPLLIMFLHRRVRQLLEKKPIVLLIPVIVNLLMVLMGFFRLL